MSSDVVKKEQQHFKIQDTPRKDEEVGEGEDIKRKSDVFHFSAPLTFPPSIFPQSAPSPGALSFSSLKDLVGKKTLCIHPANVY